MDRAPVFTINTAVNVTVNNVIFTAADYVVYGCTEYWCLHCHQLYSTLTENQTLITPHGDFISDDGLALNFGDTINFPEDSKFELYNLTYAIGNCFNKLDWLFSINNENGTLHISNTLFESWMW